MWLATLVLPNSILAQNNSNLLTHCQPTESVQFSCRVGIKIVSLCGGNTGDRITSLSYRYGAIGKIEKEFVARPENTRRFYGTVGPLNPRASLGQIWFDQGKFRYLMTACTGGNCPQHAGLAVIHNFTRILMNVPCARFTNDDFDSFRPDLVTFGSGVETTRSATELLIIEEIGGHDIHQLFPVKGGPLW